MRISIFIIGMVGLLIVFAISSIRMIFGDVYSTTTMNFVFFLGFTLSCAAWLFATFRLKRLDENAGLLEEINESVFIIERNSRTIVCVNQATIDLLDFQRDDLLHRPASHLFAGNETIVDKLVESKPLNSHAFQSLTTSAMRKNGSLIQMQLIARPVRYHGADCVMITAHNISEKAKVFEEQARLAAILESSASGLCAANQEGIITNWNKAATKILGYRAKEMLGKPFMVIIREENRQERWEWYKSMLAGDSLPPYETEVIHKTGKMVPIHVDASAIHNSKGEIIGASVLFRDIKKRKESEKELEESTLRLKIALQAAELGLWDYDCINDKINIISDPGYELFGYQAEKGWSHQKFSSLIHPLDRQQSELEIQYILNSETDTTLDLKVRFRKQDGTYRWTKINGQVTERNANGRPTRIIGICQDISKEMIERQREESEKLRIKTLLAWSERTDATREDILEFTLQKAVELTGSAFGLIGEVNSQEDQLNVSRTVQGSWADKTGIAPPRRIKTERFEIGGSPLWTKAIHTSEPVAINNPDLDIENLHFFGEHNQIERYMTVPILDEGHVAGIVMVANKEEGYASHDVIELQLLAQGMWSHIRKIELENARKKVEQEKNVILDNLQEGVLCIAEDHRIIYANRSACQMVGKPMEEIVGHTYHETCPSVNHCNTICMMHDAIDAKQSCHTEITTDKGNRYEMKTSPVSTEQGETFHVVEAFCACSANNPANSQDGLEAGLDTLSADTSNS